jgi:signal transduction histidine kinase
VKFSILYKLYAVLVITAVVPLTVAVVVAMDKFEQWNATEQRHELEEQKNIFQALVNDRQMDVLAKLSAFVARNEVVEAVTSADRNRLLTLSISVAEPADWEAFNLITADRKLLIDPIGMSRGGVDPRYEFYLAKAMARQQAAGLTHDPTLGAGIVAATPIVDAGNRVIGAVAVFDPIDKEWLNEIKLMTGYDFTLITTDRRTISSTWFPAAAIIPMPQEAPQANLAAKLIIGSAEFFALQLPLTDITKAAIGQVLFTRSSDGFHAFLNKIRIEIGTFAFGTLGIALVLGGLMSHALSSRLNGEIEQRFEAEETTKNSHEQLKQQSNQIAFMQDIARIANEAKSMRQGVEATLNRVCDYTGWNLGHAYLPEGEGQTYLLPSEIWAVRDDDPERFAPFMERTRQGCLRVGEGLFDKILENGTPVIVADLGQSDEYARREIAVACGLHAGFALAIVAGEEVLGVLEFYSTHTGQPSREFQASLPEIGLQLGRVAERARMFDRLERAANEEQKANRAKSEFLASMSHELRTPLNAVIGFSELIKNEAFGQVGNPRYIEYADDIHNSGGHLLGLINDILDLSKIESGSDELYEDNLEVPDIIDAALILTGNRAQQRGIEIEIELPDDLPALRADERKLKQILVNLLSNAIKFTNPGGKVRIKGWCGEESGYVLQVIDTGIGIALEDIPKALARFGQIDGGLNRRYDGTGLGLPLTRSLAEQHGGSLDVQSEVGVGTTVTVRFPAQRTINFQQHLSDMIREDLKTA